MFRQVLTMAILCAAMLGGQAWAEPQKMIIDTDFNTIFDDGKVLIMAAQLYAEGKIDLLGVTTVAGNNWVNQETSDALKAVERLGVDDRVGVYEGSRRPLVHDYATAIQAQALYGGYIGGAFSRPEPADDKLAPPPDGFAVRAKLRPQSAVDFIVQTIKKYPHQVTILSIGPMTNTALAIRLHPEIVPLIGRMVFMAGAFDVRGNTTPAAELNVWFDPEAARIVTREPIDMTFIPLDLTDTVPMTKAVYDQVTRDKSAIVSRLMAPQGQVYARNPDAKPFIYDTLALAYAIDPTLATDSMEVGIDVDIDFGPGYGRTLGYPPERAAPYMRKVKVIRRFDNARFYKMFIDLMTRPVPVRFGAAGGG